MNELSVPIKSNTGIIPEVISYLANIKEFEYSYKYYNLRHPGAIFNLTSTYLIRDFLILLDELSYYQNNFDSSKEIKLQKMYKQLIDGFFKFYDSFFEIIQACSKQHTPPTEKEFAWQWLVNNKYNAGKYLFNETKMEIEELKFIYDELKHSSNYLQPVYFYKDKFSIMGYYLQSVESDGSIGPNIRLHPNYENMHVASSYNFNLRILYYLIYKISDILKNVLLLHFKETYDIVISKNMDYKGEDRLWKELTEKIINLPKIYFPNEVNQWIPICYVSDTQLIFKIEKANGYGYNDLQVSFLESSDGFSRSFRMPYYNP